MEFGRFARKTFLEQGETAGPSGQSAELLESVGPGLKSCCDLQLMLFSAANT